MGAADWTRVWDACLGGESEREGERGRAGGPDDATVACETSSSCPASLGGEREEEKEEEEEEDFRTSISSTEAFRSGWRIRASSDVMFPSVRSLARSGGGEALRGSRPG